MPHPARSPDVLGDEGRTEDGEIPPIDGDYELCAKLQAYLAYRLRNADPPPPLVEAWDHFYAANAPRIKAFLKRWGLPPADFEDCFQEVWSEVIAHLRDLPYDSRRARLSTWLITVARNRAVDMIRRRRHLASLSEGTHAVVDSSPNANDAYDWISTRDQVQRVLAELSTQVSPLSFRVLYLRIIEELSTAEVADILGLPSQRVRLHLHRAKRRFRNLFERVATLPLRKDKTQHSASEQKKPVSVKRGAASCE